MEMEIRRQKPRDRNQETQVLPSSEARSSFTCDDVGCSPKLSKPPTFFASMGRFYALNMLLPDRISVPGHKRSWAEKQREHHSKNIRRDKKQSFSGRISIIFVIPYAGREGCRNWSAIPAQTPFCPNLIHRVFNVGGHADFSICCRLALKSRFGLLFDD